MVAADGEDRQPPLRQLGEEPVQQGHRLGGGHRLVIQVPRQQHAVHRLAVQQGQHLPQDVLLVPQQRGLAQALAQVQIG